MLVATLFPFRFAKAAVSKQRVSAEEQLMINDQFFRHSFVYPDFSTETEELQEFIANDLLEGTHKKALERSGVCTYMCVCVCVCMSSWKCVCRCMYVGACTCGVCECVCKCVYVCVYMCTCTCVYICVY